MCSYASYYAMPEYLVHNAQLVAQNVGMLSQNVQSIVDIDGCTAKYPKVPSMRVPQGSNLEAVQVFSMTVPRANNLH